MITGSFPPIRCGIGDYTSHLSDYLAKRLLSLTVLTSSTAVKARPDDLVLPLVDRWDIRRMFFVLNTVRSLGPDIVHIQYPANGYGYRLGPQALAILLRIAGFPIVTTIHEFTRAKLLRKASILPFIACSHALIFTAEEEQNAVRKAVPWIKRKLAAARVIPVGSNIPVTAAPMKRVPGTTVLSFFGLFYPGRMIESVAEAFHMISKQITSPVLFRFIGDVHPHHRGYFLKIKALVEHLLPQQQIDWVLGGTPEDIAAALKGSDACLLPYPDGASFRRTTLMAALSLGIPVVTTKTGSTPAELKDGQHVVFASDEDHLADAVMTVVRDKSLAKKLSENSIALSERFSWEMIADEHIRVYETLLHTER